MMDDKPRCGALTKKGQPCRNRPVRGSDPPRCGLHLEEKVEDEEVEEEEVKEAEENEAESQENEQENEQQETPANSFYRLRPDELAELVAMADNFDLGDEIALVRVTLRRLFTLLANNRDPDQEQDLAKLASLVFAGSRTIAQLLRGQQELSEEEAKRKAGAIGEALDQLVSDMELKL
jgi:negative regulator of genetic competence, sporulation and motility